MRKIYGLIFVLVISIFSPSCTLSKKNTEDKVKPEEDTQNKVLPEENELILGEFKLKDLKSSNNRIWFENNYESFTLKPEVVDRIGDFVKKENFEIVVYMGTWCEDSQREFPGFIKILDQVNFDYNDLTLIGVDEDKVVPNVSNEKRNQLNVFNVPTIIVYDEQGEEVNRFVEFPQETLEEDLLKIFSRQDYKHVYDF